MPRGGNIKRQASRFYEMKTCVFLSSGLICSLKVCRILGWRPFSLGILKALLLCSMSLWRCLMPFDDISLHRPSLFSSRNFQNFLLFLFLIFNFLCWTLLGSIQSRNSCSPVQGKLPCIFSTVIYFLPFALNLSLKSSC